MIIAGLDTFGLIILVIAVAIFVSYILVSGINIEFTKSSFSYIVLVLILLGMFIMAWLRETGDELLIVIALFIATFLLVLKKVLHGRRARRR